ncbi:anthranilate phosphoribosyltransferase [Halorutilales archaeon Cl-col2-1]
MEEYIEKTVDGENLSLEEAKEAADAVFEDATDAQIGALLAGLRAKGETEEEIAGFAMGMRDAAETISPDAEPLIDTCGTGGDDYDTINVSTATSVVAASADVAVAKHGNYSVSSNSGSADVFDELGVEIEADPDEVERSIEEAGIGFMLAPVFHPAMGRVIGPRKELGMRTVFNILGPLTNPAGADAQVVGVYDEDLVGKIARVLSLMEVEDAVVVHGSGLDEICLHGETTVAETHGDDVEEYSITPEEIGLERAPIDEVAGGGPEENARDLERIFSGEEDGAKRDIVLANSGAALYVAGVAGSFEEGVEIAENRVEEGDPLEKLHDFSEIQ